MIKVQPAFSGEVPVVARSAASIALPRADEDSTPKSLAPPPVLPNEGARAEASERVVRNLEEETNDKLEETAVHVKIDRDDDLNRLVIKVLDDDGELLNQFPSEDFLATSVQLEELRGLLFNAKG